MPEYTINGRETRVDPKRVEECPDCGESRSKDFDVIMVNKNCITWSCASCSGVADMWTEDL